MKRIFYTFDTMEHGSGMVDENADIQVVEFEDAATIEEIESCLLGFAQGQYDDTFKIDVKDNDGVAQFSDCWIKTPAASVDEVMETVHRFSPFTLEELNITPPGNHPGFSNYYWVTPNVYIYTFDAFEIDDDED